MKYTEVENAPRDSSLALLTQIRKQFPPGVCSVLENSPAYDKLGVDHIFVTRALIQMNPRNSSVRLGHCLKNKIILMRWRRMPR